MFKYIIIYLIIVNIIASLINIIDKSRAKRGAWRIPEATLWFFAIIGGALGTYITMKLIRHKTKHKKFMIGIPAILIMQILLIAYYLLQL